MAYDAQLAARIRMALADTAGVEDRKMFGGIAFLQRGNIDEALAAWVGRALEFAATLPPKR
jgi:hypothetical protein